MSSRKVVDSSIKEIHSFTIEQAIFGSCVKFDRLDTIVYKAFCNTSIATATELNIFIDLFSVVHNLFSEHYRVSFNNYTDITSCLINLCAHYRMFFRRLGVSTTFYLIFSTNCCSINRKFVADYNEQFFVKSQIPESRKITEDNFKLMTALCPYLPDIHFIRSIDNYEVSVIIANLIETLNDGRPNMIISRDIYPIQLTYLYPYTTFLYSRKHGGTDTSDLLPVFQKSTYRTEFWDIIRRNRRVRTENLVDLSPVNYTLISSIMGFPDRGIKTLYNYTKAADLVRSIVGSEDIKIQIQQLYTNEIMEKYNVNLIESRFNTLDVPAMLYYYRNSPEAKNIKLLNLNDDSVINKINAKYFERNPIDLQAL